MFALVAGACLIKERVLGELGLHKLWVVLLVAGVYHVGYGGSSARWRTTQPHQVGLRVHRKTRLWSLPSDNWVPDIASESEDEGRNGADEFAVRWWWRQG
jgi:hypothetical protein